MTGAKVGKLELGSPASCGVFPAGGAARVSKEWPKRVQPAKLQPTMNSVTVEIDGFSLQAEILQLVMLDAQRTAITVRTQEKLDRGRSCILRYSGGQTLDCVISNCNAMGSVYVVEFRCLQDASFLIG